MAVKRFFTKVAGVTHKNADGTSRQEIIEDCFDGERLVLEREPNNLHDPNAVLVRTEGPGDAIGYLSADTVQGRSGIAALMDRGIRVQARVKEVTGESPKGVNLEIAYWDGPLEEEPTEDYFGPRNPGCLPGCAREFLTSCLGCLGYVLAFSILVAVALASAL